MLVSELKNSDGDWNLTLLQQVLCDDDFLSILKIPNSLKTTLDKILWHLSKDGEYSVQSRYRITCDALPMAGISSPKEWKIGGRVCESLESRQKFGAFVSKVGRDWLPTSGNLARRGTVIDSCFFWCPKGKESTFHAIWGYGGDC